MMDVACTTQQRDIISDVLSRIGDICTLPEVAARIIELVDDPDSTARELHEVIKNDPALSSKVLKMVNSAFYGLPGSIKSLERAIICMGLSPIKNIAIACSVGQVFGSADISNQFSARDLWKHSVAVAVLARSLACLAGIAEKEELFLAGLIHDVGILIERQVFASKLAEAIDRTVAGEDTYLNCERLAFGVDHQMLGAELARSWRFPDQIRACVMCHHDARDAEEELQQRVSIVQLADIIACRKKIGFYLSADKTEITADLSERAKLTQELIHSFLQGTEFESQRQVAEALLLS